MKDLIYRVYNYSEHRSSDEPNSISVTTIIGSLYKAKMALNGQKDESLIEDVYKRSSTLGSAFHAWAEKALSKDDKILQEIYRERKFDKFLITGSCDLLVRQPNGKYRIGDWKTGYGKKRTQEQLDKDIMQLSLYRWLLKDEYEIEDTGSILFISQSNNVQEEYEVELKCLGWVDNYLEDRLWTIENNIHVDCFDAVKYNPCTYCSWICENRKESK